MMPFPSPAPGAGPVPPTRPHSVPDPTPHYRDVLWFPCRALCSLHRQRVSPTEGGAAGCRGPEAQLLQVHPQQRSGSERQAAAGAEEGPHVQHPGKQSGWNHSRGSPRGVGTPGWAEVCTDLLVAVAVAGVFEATVAMMDAGLGRESRTPSPAQPWTFPLFTTGTGMGKKNVAEPPEQSTENKMREGLLPCVPSWLQSTH